MKVTFCDACGDECELGSYTFDPLIHIASDSGYVDMDWNRVSGRRENYDVCHACYNDIYDAAFAVFKGKMEATP